MSNKQQTKRTRVLLLCRYGAMAASTRHRLLQYVPYLTEQGFDVHVETLLDDHYLQRLYSGQRVPVGRIAKSYADRVSTLLRARKYDLIWIHIEAFPWIPGFVESSVMPRGVPYVVDYDDAMYHRYDRHASSLVRALLSKKIDRVMRDAALVVVGNEYIAERAWEAGANRVEILPTVLDLARYSVVPPRPRNVFTIGWIGSPATAYNLQLIRPALAGLREQYPIQLIAVGSGDLDLGEIPLEIRPWSEATEVNDIQQFDVGIMPLVDSPFERGKSGFKLIQYMACARPVIGSPVGVNQTIITNAMNGYLASTPDEWLSTLRTLAIDSELRQRMGKSGRRLVEERYTLQIAAPRLAELLQAAL